MYAPFSGDNANTLPPIGSFELALCFHEVPETHLPRFASCPSDDVNQNITLWPYLSGMKLPIS